MNETAYKQQMRDNLKAHGYLVIRFEDRFTSGIPDFHIAGWNKGGLWLEAKIDEHLLEPWKWDALKLQQVVFCHYMQIHCTDHVLFICYAPKQNKCVIVPPNFVLSSAREKIPLLENFMFDGNGLEQILQELHGGCYAK